MGLLGSARGERTRYPQFHVEMNAEVVALATDDDDGRVNGLRVKTPSGTFNVAAQLVVGADGRHSIVRAHAGLEIDELGVPIDVLWFRLPRRASDGGQPFFRATPGRIGALIVRREYFQCAMIVPKGSFERIQLRGLSAFRRDVAELFPFLADRVGELHDWNDVKLLTVKIDRLKRWAAPGLLCIGDAAHAMSPIGGVGINLAIQDAVATANLLADALARGATPTLSDLDRVQRRRDLPTRWTQRLQTMVQDAVFGPVLDTRSERAHLVAPWSIRALARLGVLPRLAARVIGSGIRPEHVRSPNVGAIRHFASAA
jgi:2-polyprenyl-6-methoxyphenol hydroxylase-like FAD-dependent oxidoreductase